METTKDLIIGNTVKCLFSRMLDIGVGADLSKKIMSFWMFLESKDFKNIYERLNSQDDRFLGFFCAEAEILLAFLLEHSSVRPLPSISCPFTLSTLTNSDISLINILQDHEKVSKEILAFHDNICSIAFEDILEERGLKGKFGDHENAQKASGGEGSSKEMEMHGTENAIRRLSLSQQLSGSTLNPFAKEWNPSLERASIEDRSLFMTFSRGHPISPEEITNHFEMKFGDCVEDVRIHQPRDRDPEFGKIVFKYSNIPSFILEKNESVKHYIGGKTLCLKRFNPAAGSN